MGSCHRINHTSYADQFTSASYQYDSLGRLIEQTTQFQTLDATGNPTGATQTSASKTLKTSYHANSQVKAKTDAEDNLTSYSYDGAGKLSQIAIQNAGSILVNDYEGTYRHESPIQVAPQDTMNMMV